jgi:hypothetical protein
MTDEGDGMICRCNWPAPRDSDRTYCDEPVVFESREPWIRGGTVPFRWCQSHLDSHRLLGLIGGDSFVARPSDM